LALLVLALLVLALPLMTALLLAFLLMSAVVVVTVVVIAVVAVVYGAMQQSIPKHPPPQQLLQSSIYLRVERAWPVIMMEVEVAVIVRTTRRVKVLKMRQKIRLHNSNSLIRPKLIMAHRGMMIGETTNLSETTLN
jgi:hypothetical protein